MQLIDSQIHLFEPGAEEFATRMMQTLMPPQAVVAEMDAAGVSRAYLVPGNGAANAACVAAAKQWPDRFRVMGILGLDKAESRTLVAEWPNAGWIGVRLTFPPYRKVSWLKDGTADWFWPEADRLALPVMIWAPQQVDEIARLAERWPRIRFIIDHLNLFVEDKGEVVDRAVEALLPLARYPGIAVKLSALPAHSSQSFPFCDMHPHVRRVVDAFGAQRCLWGTDLTRKACSYQEAITMFTEHMPFLDAAQLEQIMGASAMRWIGWGEARR
ncbi:MAG: amidohydrolase family protein [Burkholderiaceae bacterium]